MDLNITEENKLDEWLNYGCSTRKIDTCDHPLSKIYGSNKKENDPKSKDLIQHVCAFEKDLRNIKKKPIKISIIEKK